MSLRRLREKLRARRRRSRRVRSGAERSLYRTPSGDLFWLDPEHWLDGTIIEQGGYEPMSTRVVERLVSPGDVVFDVGANIGWFSVLMSRCVGPEGRVVAFEPTEFYGAALRRNVEENELENCEIRAVALSNETGELAIQIGESSATMHWPTPDLVPRREEKIRLRRLDDVVRELAIERLDFVKVDIDGHEPFFLEGAWQTFERHRPTLLMEVSALNLLDTSWSALEFYETLREHGLRVYSEKTLREFANREAFLIECGNYAYSANIVASYEPLAPLA